MQQLTLRLKKILVPTDFSEASRKALRYALGFAKQFNAEIELLHVIAFPMYPEFGYAHLAIKAHKLTQAANQRLQLLRNEAPADANLITSAVVRTGSVSREIVQAAADQQADLILLSTHGHTGLAHVLLGSTTEKVLRHAPCPVLVVR